MVQIESGLLISGVIALVASVLIVVVLAYTGNLGLRSARQLRQSETQLRRFRKAFEEAGHAIYITDTDGIIQFVNPAFTRITGYGAEEAIGASTKIFKSGEMDDSYYKRMWDTLLAGKRWSEVIVNRSKGGALYYADQTIAPVTDDAGVIEQFVAIQTDISEQRRTEQHLADRERQYRLLAEHSTDMISRHSLDGTYLYVSPASRSLLGYEPEELVGRRFADFVESADPESAGAHTGSAPLPTDDSVVTVRMRHRRGHTIWCETTSTPVKDPDPDSGKVTETVSVTRNIEQRKQVEQNLLRAKAEAEDANHAKGRFIANMSHEIRTPLNAVLGYAEILRKRLDDEELRSYAELIQSSGEGLLHLLNDVLDLSKIDAGKVAIAPSPTNLVAIANEVTAMFTIQAKEKGLELSMVDSGNVPQQLVLDGSRLRQILINLIGNSVKFTESGKVEITIDATRHDSTADVMISISDAGIGIPDEKLDAIFEPFIQQDPSIHERYGGTGLGLAITQGLLDALGGTVSVESTVGVGSIFTVTIPGVAVITEPANAPQTGRPVHGTQEEMPVVLGAASGRETAQSLASDDPRVVDALRQILGPESLDQLQRLFTVKMIDELSDLACTIRDAATEIGAANTAALAAKLVDAAGRFDVQRIDEIALLLERQLFGEKGNTRG